MNIILQWEKIMLAKMALLLLAGIFLAQNAWAHFGIVIPSRSMVMEKKHAELGFDIAFCHPFAGQGMDMAAPERFFVVKNGKSTNLAASLAPQTYMGAPAFGANYKIGAPGVYQFAVVPRPYYEKAEDCFIIHYAKTVVGAFGAEDGWDTPIGLPVEIVPASRPFGNYAGNIFSGIVLKNGKPAANVPIEVEYLNNPPTHRQPNAYFETQTVLSDANGAFSFGIPWPGWWGFAALTESDRQIEHDGKPKNVEEGGVIWLNFAAPELR